MGTICAVLLLCVCQDPKPSKPIEPKRVDAVVVPEGSLVCIEPKLKAPIDSIIVSDETVIRVDASPRKGGKAFYFEAKSVGVCRLKLTDVDGKVDELLVVVEKKAAEKKPKK